MRRHLVSAALVWAALLQVSSVRAVELTDVTAAQDAQNAFITRNAGDPALQLELESQLASIGQNVNFALVDQVEGTANRADIDQQGSGNLALVGQGFGNGNQVFLNQPGDDNYAVVTQGGNNNTVGFLSQLGNSNRVTLSQQGDSNTATVAQYGDRNELSLTQVDSFNTASIEQYGNTDLTLTQTNPGGSASAVNALALKAYTEPGATMLVHSAQFDGPGSNPVTLCSGSVAYCDSVMP